MGYQRRVHGEALVTESGVSISIIIMEARLILIVLLVGLVVGEEEIGVTSAPRQPKLFFVATSVSTISTTSNCFVGAASVTACTKRKRAIINDWDNPELLNIPLPDKVDSAIDQEDMSDLESGLKDGDKHIRDARFLLYYATSTSTTTSYTGTLGTLECTPSSYALSSCTG